MRKTYTLCRYGAAFLVITYGFAKLTGAQFTVLDSELDKPLGQVSGFWLTWHYFGYSKVYGNLIALGQVGGGVMLLFRKTTLLGACFLLPVITNIVLVDIFYGVELQGLFAALLVAALLLTILSAHKRELLDLLWTRQNSVLPSGPTAPRADVLKYAVRALIIAAPLVLTYWLANYNNRVPTPIDGVWDVVGIQPAADGAAAPAVFFFEKNRAFMCVVKGRDGSYAEHHFEVDAVARSVSVWQLWMRKGAKILEGDYDADAARLRLRGGLGGRAGESLITLTRRR